MDSLEDNIAYRFVPRPSGCDKPQLEPAIYAAIPERDLNATKPSGAQTMSPPHTATSAETNMNDATGENIYDYIDDHNTTQHGTGTSFLGISTNASHGIAIPPSGNEKSQEESHIYELESEEKMQLPTIPPRNGKVPATSEESGKTASLCMENPAQEEDDYMAMDGSA